MEVGIITMFHNSSNYGGVLQAYALCKVLEKQGISAEQISYDNYSAFSFERRIKKKIHNLITIISHVKDWREQGQLSYGKRKVRIAAQKLVPHTKIVYTEKTIANCVSDYRVFITGSD